ncbi:ABC transporter substrate-binding protein [Effusibacillus lacus]|uniref:ABC transporter substrate-binding protein n=1 Tax=Effusibacillus lacus TaxID=1348429 RepID=A0A292YR85_9BACL|nr:cobalamin-binding protein [Effusibacillus lacus]TCS76053.1 iron complex transport system substrate-binding protein [Effusibacillus lacus]GAX91429.1 ABC transporter substrate-binding protein [Effusibacillus lacus]
MNKWFSIVTALILATGITTGCGTKETAQQQPTPSQDKTTSGQQTIYPLTIKDATGTEVTIKEEPKRIVSLVPSETEILFALGLGDKIVGVDKWSDYPAEAKSKPIIGDLKTDTEKVVAQKPDLVVGGASLNTDAIQALRKLGLTVYAVEPKTFAEVQQAIKDIGKITNSAAKAEEIVKYMDQKLADVKGKLKGLSEDKKPLVYVEVYPAPEIFTAGKGTFMDELVTLAGGRNAFADTNGWAKISGEQVVAKKPQLIISTHGVTNQVQADILKRDGWESIPAVKEKRIVAVDTNLVSRPGPRLAEGLEQFAKAIHPDLFKE